MFAAELSGDDENDGDQVGDVESNEGERNDAIEGGGGADVDEGEEDHYDGDKPEGVQGDSQFRMDLHQECQYTFQRGGITST